MLGVRHLEAAVAAHGGAEQRRLHAFARSGLAAEQWRPIGRTAPGARALSAAVFREEVERVPVRADQDRAELRRPQRDGRRRLRTAARDGARSEKADCARRAAQRATYA